MSTMTIEQSAIEAREPITETLLEIDGLGRAWIKGANTKVIEVALDWIAYRWDAETMHREHPHLSLAQLHAALSYYFAHQEGFDAEVKRQLEEIARLRAEAGESPIAAKLRKMGKLI